MKEDKETELIKMTASKTESLLKGGLCLCLIVICVLAIALVAVAGTQNANMPEISSDVQSVINLLKYGDDTIETAGEPYMKLVVATACITVILILATLLIWLVCCVKDYLMSLVCGYSIIMVIGGLVIPVVLIIMQSVSIALWYQYYEGVNTKFGNGEYSTTLLTDIYDNFRADTITGSETQSIAWNKLFLQYKCCGVNAVPVGDRGDFQTSYWARSGTAGSQKIPTSCCVGATESSYTAATTCKDNVNSGTYHATGCFDKIKEDFDFSANSRALLGLTITVILLEVAFVCLSITYYFVIIKHKREVYNGKTDHPPKEKNDRRT